MSTGLVYALAGAMLFLIGLLGLLLLPHLMRKILAFNVLGSGAFLVLVGFPGRDGVSDPVPHAMVLTGIVVAIAATALALALARRLFDLTGKMRLPEDGADPGEGRADSRGRDG